MNDREISLKNEVDIISDIYTVDPNNRRIQKEILNKMLETSNILFDETNEIQNKLNEYFDYLYENGVFDLNRSYNIEIPDLLKIAGFYIDYEPGNTLDRLITYISSMKEYLNIELFILINLFSHINEEERRLFSETMISKDIEVLCIESTYFNGNKSEYENEEIYILDKDYCEI